MSQNGRNYLLQNQINDLGNLNLILTSKRQISEEKLHLNYHSIKSTGELCASDILYVMCLLHSKSMEE